MRTVDTKPAQLHPLTKERLSELKTALRLDEGVTVNESDIIGALVHANTVAQLVALLPVYKRYTSRHQPQRPPET
jgi:hypothetical protein